MHRAQTHATNRNIFHDVTWQAPLSFSLFEWMNICRTVNCVHQRNKRVFHMFFFVSIWRDRFPFYKSNDDRWKNSVRHNLSINPHFRKGNKAPQGAGHLWIISTRDSEANILAWEHVSSVKSSVLQIHCNTLNDSSIFAHRKNNGWNCFSKWRKHSRKAWKRLPTLRQLQ